MALFKSFFIRCKNIEISKNLRKNVQIPKELFDDIASHEILESRTSIACTASCCGNLRHERFSQLACNRKR